MAQQQLVSVTSSSIDSVGYGPKTKSLVVKFKNGGVYVYADVETSVYVAFMSASSKGNFLDAEIKQKYSFIRIDESEISQWIGDTTKPKQTRPRNRMSKFTGLSGATCFI